MEFIPQFPDGSGWEVEDKKAPYFYEHVTHAEVRHLRASRNKAIYKIVTILDYTDQPHKDTYFVPGKFLQKFLEEYITPRFFLEVVSIERVESMPPTDEKSSQ